MNPCYTQGLLFLHCCQMLADLQFLTDLPQIFVVPRVQNAGMLDVSLLTV